MCEDNRMTFLVGERREITSEIKATNKKEAIDSSTYTFKKESGGSLVSEGECEIKGNEVIVLLDFPQKGTFILEIESCVGREKVKSKTYIDVE